MGSITKCLSTILHLKASLLYDWIMVAFRWSTFKTERYYTPSTYFLPQHYFWPYCLIQLSSLVPEFTSPKHLTLFSLSQSEFLCSGSVTENEACWIYTIKFPEGYQWVNELKVIWRREHFNIAHLILYRGEGRKTVHFQRSWYNM